MIEKQEIIDYVFKDEPNPYVLDSMLTEISEESGSSESDMYKDAAITLINSNPDGSYIYYDLLDQMPTRVFIETTVYLPVLNIPSGKTYVDINFFDRINPNKSPVCIGNVECDTTSHNFIITGDGTITLAGQTVQ